MASTSNNPKPISFKSLTLPIPSSPIQAYTSLTTTLISKVFHFATSQNLLESTPQVFINNDSPLSIHFDPSSPSLSEISFEVLYYQPLAIILPEQIYSTTFAPSFFEPPSTESYITSKLPDMTNQISEIQTLETILPLTIYQPTSSIPKTLEEFINMIYRKVKKRIAKVRGEGSTSTNHQALETYWKNFQKWMTYEF